MCFSDLQKFVKKKEKKKRNIERNFGTSFYPKEPKDTLNFDELNKIFVLHR